MPMDFGTMISRMANKLIVDDMNTEIGEAINGAITYYADEPLWFTQAETLVTLVVNDPVIPNIPTDLLYERLNGLVIYYDQASYTLTKVQDVEYDAMNTQASGLPYWYIYRDGQYLVYFWPDQAYSLNIRYRKSYPDMVQSSDTNDWLTYAWRLIEAKALSDFYLDYRHEPEMALLYGQKATTELLRVRDQSDERQSTGTLLTENIIDRGYLYDPTITSR